MSGMWKWWSFVIIAAAATTPGLSSPERTVAMIKPDGVQSNHTSAIKQIILAEGFSILKEKSKRLDPVAVKSFYREHVDRTFFPSLLSFMTSGPVHAMILEREDAITRWRTLMGPTDSTKAKMEAPNSIRAKFGKDGEKNCVHGSDSPRAVVREIEVLFGTATQGTEVEDRRGRHEEL